MMYYCLTKFHYQVLQIQLSLGDITGRQNAVGYMIWKFQVSMFFCGCVLSLKKNNNANVNEGCEFLYVYNQARCNFTFE